MIPQRFIEEIQSRADIVDIVSSYIPLKRAGRNFKTLCPFHGERTPSFMVSPQKQIFHCFGCGEGGGVFQFISLMEKVDFPEAVEILARRLGLTVPHERTAAGTMKNILYDAMNEASLLFHKNLKQTPQAKPVIDYLKKRGIGEKTIDTFRLGLALPGNQLMEDLRKKGFKLDVLEKASLVSPGQQGYRDLFRDRVMFPIFDVRSRVIGFGGRTWRPAATAPKYINSLENPVYSKRAHLYGLNFSKEHIAARQAAVVVEGYLDMITPFMRGMKNIVASLGTALTAEQIRMIKRYTPCVILVFDSDTAGQNATLRSIDLLLEADLQVLIAELPAGRDPDSLVREKGIEAFQELIDKKTDFFDYKLALLRRRYSCTTIEGKTRVAENMLVSIDALPSEIKKYEYIKRLAVALDIKEEILIAEFRKSFSKGKGTRLNMPAAAVFAEEPISITEKVVLKCMVVNQKAFALVKKSLRPENFYSVSAQKAIQYFFAAHAVDSRQTIAQCLGAIPERQISSFISRLLLEDEVPSDKTSFKESVLKIKKRHALSQKKKLKDQIKQAEAVGDRHRLDRLIAEYSKMQ